jgi:transcription antitermination factor NusG
VLHTKSRQEKAVAAALDAAGVEQYLPLIAAVRFYGHRKRRVEMPLFASYVFSRGTRESAHLAMGTGRIVNVIEVGDQARFEHEVRQIRAALSGGAELQPYGFLTKGRRVRVTSGPFRDLEGLIEDSVRADRLVLQVQALGRATSLEIDASLLEPVD